MNNNQILLCNGHILHAAGAWPTGWIMVEGGKIAHMDEGRGPNLENARCIDLDGGYVLPGFIDIHVHGALGFDTMHADPDGLCQMARFYASHGTTSFLPTTWTESNARISASIAAVKSLVNQPTGGARILGIHLEGPYISENKIGAQDPRHVRRADRAEALAWLDSGIVRLIALAPEFPDNHWLIEAAAQRGVIVSAAHTEAGPEEIANAVALGLRQSTHTFNAMNGLHHRKPGTVGAVLAEDAITCELIADTIHVHPLAMKILVRAKGLDKVILVSDAVSVAGLPDGEHEVAEGRPVTVKDNLVLMPDGTISGSMLVMDAALRNIMAAAGLTIEQAWPLTSLNAARQLGIDDHTGQIAPGYDADLVVLDQALQVQFTMVGGEIVYRAEGA